VWTSGGPFGGNDVRALAIAPWNASLLFAISNHELFRSTDSGATWASTEQTVDALALDPSTPERVYAGGSNFVRSTDSGATWTATRTSPLAHVSVLTVDPVTPTTVYSGSDYIGARAVSKSTDSGETWVGADSGLR